MDYQLQQSGVQSTAEITNCNKTTKCDGKIVKYNTQDCDR